LVEAVDEASEHHGWANDSGQGLSLDSRVPGLFNQSVFGKAQSGAQVGATRAPQAAAQVVEVDMAGALEAYDSSPTSGRSTPVGVKALLSESL
jgi:hypothetical protein